MKRLITLIISICICTNSLQAQEAVKGVFVSRLDSLLLESQFNSEFQDWISANNINTIFVYNPYLSQDSKFQKQFYQFYHDNSNLKWIAVVSTSSGFTELFADSIGIWDGFLLEKEWWREGDSFRDFQKEIKTCLMIRPIPHYAYLGWLSSSNSIAKKQAKRIAKHSDFVMLHTYAREFDPNIVADRIEYFEKTNAKILMLHSMQKKYAYTALYGNDFSQVNSEYLERLNGTLKKPAKNLAGFVIFTYLDAIQD